MSASRGCLVILLCLCVFFQMLGVPAPLLDAGASFETNESSIQEGWSVDARHVLDAPGSRFTTVVDVEPVRKVPLLALGRFRPPLC